MQLSSLSGVKTRAATRRTAAMFLFNQYDAQAFEQNSAAR
jgi:hypothetical protein